MVKGETEWQLKGDAMIPIILNKGPYYCFDLEKVLYVQQCSVVSAFEKKIQKTDFVKVLFADKTELLIDGYTAEEVITAIKQKAAQ
jgi:hypothetical protein